jgi:hypothetical protein
MIEALEPSRVGDDWNLRDSMERTLHALVIDDEQPLRNFVRTVLASDQPRP